MTVSFEKFPVYNKTIDFTIDIFELLDQENLAKEFAIRDQLKRATISISNNIAEGSEYGSNKQFVRLLWISKGSSAEVRNMLYILFRLKKIDEIHFKQLSERCFEISVELYHFIKYLEKTNAK